MRKNTVVNQYELPMEIKKEGKWYIAKCPIWRDCYAQSDTVDGVVFEITGVAKTLIEIYQEKDLKVPLGITEKELKRCEIIYVDKLVGIR